MADADYPAPANADHGSRSFLAQNYGLAFGALRGLNEDATVTEVTGEDMIRCIETGGVDMNDQEKDRVLEQMGLTRDTARQSIPLAQLVTLTNEHSRPASAHRTHSPPVEEDDKMENLDELPHGVLNASQAAPRGKTKDKGKLLANSFRPVRRDKRMTGSALPKTAIDTPSVKGKRRGSIV